MFDDAFKTALQAEEKRLRDEARASYERERVTNPESAGMPLIGCYPDLAKWVLAYGARAERERLLAKIRDLAAAQRSGEKRRIIAWVADALAEAGP